ncbi:MAG: UDP-N-acetylmuramate--L-alanine ligase [Betaproteobacteria bacterium]|jgi:UDP-N-acetylmuramate--alanine ligase|nr:MAG: UDP-N-acetylmuramate--L-alanine ligase [Betaproteobacteria bacterium]
MRHKVKHVHFVGIGGSGMSGIAEVMLNLDFEVTGSDLSGNAAIARLRSLGAQIKIGHKRENISGADVVVTSTAVKADNPEVAAARFKRIPVVPRAMMLAELMRLKQGIAVAGTHGKTTTTSLIASVLAEAGMDPTFVIGGRLEAAGSHAKLGTGEFIVAEADESDASFLYLQPVIAVVTNIDADHMDTYGHDFGRLRQAFLEFVEHLPFYGTAILCVDDENVRSLLPIITKTVSTYGLNEAAHIRAVDIVHSGGKMRFQVTRRAQADETALPDLRITLNIPGEHNVRNALATIAVAMEVGVPDEAIVRALAGFRGVGRRFQSYGEIALGKGKSFTLIDDYGHHPAEIAPTIDAARGAFPKRRLVLAFQPHRYTRTRDCFEDFVRVLSTVDVLLLTEVYAAGESPIVAADGRALVRAIRVAGKVEPIFVEDVAELPAAIREIVGPGDVVVTMGAGTIGSVPAVLAGAELVTH